MGRQLASVLVLAGSGTDHRQRVDDEMSENINTDLTTKLAETELERDNYKRAAEDRLECTCQDDWYSCVYNWMGSHNELMRDKVKQIEVKIAQVESERDEWHRDASSHLDALVEKQAELNEAKSSLATLDALVRALPKMSEDDIKRLQYSSILPHATISIAPELSDAIAALLQWRNGMS